MIIIIILLLFFTSSSESFTNLSELNKLNKGANGHDVYNIHNHKINFMYTKHDGIYKQFIDIYITDTINNNPVLIRNVLKNIDMVDTGFYNYKYNYLGLLYKNNIYKFNLFTQKLEAPIFIKDYFRGIKNTKIKCLFYLENNIYIFNDKKVNIYNLTDNTIIKTADYKKVFEKCPTNIECCFLNYNDVILNNPLPYIYILSNNTYYKYKYNESNNQFSFIDTTKNLKKNIIIDISKKHKITDDSYYRITCIGGGNEYGGKGGMIFNDIKLNNNDMLKIIIGKKGNRLPIKSGSLSTTNNLSKLPNTGSCSGAGATSFYKNGDLNMIAGGGGGWTSEMITAPSICNSISYNENNKTVKPNLFFPIKKIVILSPNSNKSRYKIVVNKFDVKVTNFEDLNLEIYENPKIKYKSKSDSESKSKYETHFSKFKEKASIEIIFNEAVCDYKINLDFRVVSTDKNSDSHIDSKVIFYDEQNRQYVISNFNDTFNSNIITSDSLLSYFSNNNLPKIEHNNDLVKNGASKDNYNSMTQNHSSKLFYLDNPYKICGGGYATSNKFNTLNSCGGGGGYKGGKSISLSEDYNYKNIQFPIDYVGACGGTSYINNLSIKDSESHFINNYNEGDGLVILTRIK